MIGSKRELIMDGERTERKPGKVFTLVLVALSVLVVGSRGVDGRVCYYGQERDPESEGKLRWILPSEDHENRCSCTRIRIGGVNPTVAKGRLDGASFTDQPLFTSDVARIRAHFKCKDASTNQPSATTNGQPTTPTDPPTTTTDHPTTTKVPPTTPTEPTTTTKPVYVDCQALLDDGHTESGVYNITPSQYPDGLEVYCHINTNSKKGWIVFQRRVDDTVNFTRSWAEYRDGFGDKEGSFWLGNEILRRLTEPVDEEWQMRVRLNVADAPKRQSGAYNDFRVDGENYTLHVGAFTADPDNPLSDCLSPPPGGEPPSNGQPFTTYDQDNDAEPDLNCADELKGGWWFNRCTDTGSGVGRHSNLNGEYSQIPPNDEYGRGIVWSNIYQQITRTEMKIRRCDG
ncbi:fibrinogen-like protein 1 isoform X2 [Asterias rubens]|uniref:fibrinogen-like protein 1 isoform X2 n=1 Tax=Asterias rubens TaxID=7604 RepID=UPI001455D0E1|nr:fibrinogen-like protein 1 isoform X2 [Asterias rubens]